MSNADNASNNMEESYHNIPSSKYFWISRRKDHGIAVHYGFFKIWTASTVIFTAASTAILLLTNWWQLLFTRALTFLFIDYYYIGFPAVGISIAVLYVRHNLKEKKKLLAQMERNRIRKYQDAVIGKSEVNKK